MYEANSTQEQETMYSKDFYIIESQLQAQTPISNWIPTPTSLKWEVYIAHERG